MKEPTDTSQESDNASAHPDISKRHQVARLQSVNTSTDDLGCHSLDFHQGGGIIGQQRREKLRKRLRR